MIRAVVDNEFAYTPAPFGLSRRYHRHWRQFAFWCSAAERRALPAATLTVAEFLADNPGKPATQAGRLTAINRAHQASDLPAPGRAEAIRQALDESRARRIARLRNQVDELLAQIPSWGWPGGLAGRRNAAILTLAAAGLSSAQMARLTLGDVVFAEGAIHLGTQPLVTLTATGAGPRCPVAAVRGWLDVRPALQRYNGHALLKSTLESQTLPGIPSSAVDPGQPLFIRLDRHGYSPMPFVAAPGQSAVLPPLPADSIASIVAAHLTGRPPKYPIQQRYSDDPDRIDNAEPMVEPDLGNDYYERGTAARRRDNERLADVDDRLDAILEQMDDWMARTDELLRDALT